MDGKPRRVSVNSFGYGGTNVHVGLKGSLDPPKWSASYLKELLLLAKHSVYFTNALCAGYPRSLSGYC